MTVDPRREVAAAIRDRHDASLRDIHARIAVDERVAVLLTRSRAVFANTETREIVTGAARVERIRIAFLDEELGRLLSFLAERDLSPLVIKGAHLAHAVYEDPLARPRCDTDLLIAPAERRRMERALLDAGYQRSVHVRGTVILGQWHFERRDRTGMVHHLDVHWRAAAPIIADRLLPVGALIAAAQPLRGFPCGARAPALEDALALACLHLAAHHWPNVNLRWAYDLVLLAHALGDAGRERFAATAERRGYCTVSARVLAAADDLFDDDVLRALAERLRRTTAVEASAGLLAVRTRAGALWLDLRVAGWRDRLRLLREHLVPDRAYMKATAAGRPLALAYTLRAMKGARRWFSASGRTAE